MLDLFCWRSYDIRALLPHNWQLKIEDVTHDAILKTLHPRSVTSRESNRNLRIPTLTVNGITARKHLPWLYDLYKGLFRELAQLGNPEPVSTAMDDRYGAVLNIQRGKNMRYECHIDSNPIEGLLYVTNHPKGAGGELVVANDTSASNVPEVDKNCSVIYPTEGNIIFFDARRFSHYVRPLNDENSSRIVVAMNFYTPSCPESSRPPDLNDHLFGGEIAHPK